MNEIADIFQQHGAEYRSQHKLPLSALKAMSAIESCRTSQLGGHVDACDDCGHIKISYNSCRNRHCPKCQNLPKEKWVEARKKDLLPIPYFHIVFTLPDDLNRWVLMNKKELYALLFKASAQTLQELAADPKYLGAQIGFISVLHTWGQNLMDHPHVHCIVTGGGLCSDQATWIPTKQNFFLPVKVMSRLFRGKFLSALKKLQTDRKLEDMESDSCFRKTLEKLYNKEWIVYCKAPFKGPEHVLEYLGRYTHKVAISNQRICRIADRNVTFKWRDYKDGERNKQMTLDVFEFIRRFLLHILPQGFMKIRHYGILSNHNRENQLVCCKEILGMPVIKKEKDKKKETWSEFLFRLTGVDPTLCLICGKGHMITKLTLQPQGHSPPQLKITS